MRPTLFLDRDGVINVDRGHVHRIEDFEFIPGIFELVGAANEADWYVVVVTNQAGIAKGYYTAEDFALLTMWMCDQFRENGAHIDAVYHCPHHPEFGNPSTRNCDCRKPKPGMILAAVHDMGIDVSRSILVGDKDTDMAAGRAASIGNLVKVQEKGRDYGVIEQIITRSISNR